MRAQAARTRDTQISTMDMSSLGLVGQFRPDFLPVIRAQLTAGDDAFCGQLNRGAVLSRNGLAFEPSSYGCLYDAASLGQLLLRTNDSNGL